MTPLDLVTSTTLSRSRDDDLRAVPTEDVRAANAFLLASLERAAVFDVRETHSLLVQRLDVAGLDLSLAVLHSQAPSVAESVMRQRVRDRLLAVLGVEPPESLVAHFEHRTRQASKRFLNEGTFRDDEAVLHRAFSMHGTFRCAHCGYHFRRVDFRDALRETVIALGAPTAPSIDPRREGDKYKPCETPGKAGPSKERSAAMRWTDAEIEHLVPTASLGENDLDNLVVSCAWCNRGKHTFRSRGEIMPDILSVAFNDLHEEWRRWHVQRAFYCIVSKDRRCSVCTRGPSEVELTIQVASHLEVRPSYLPKAICYECRT